MSVQVLGMEGAPVVIRRPSGPTVGTPRAHYPGTRPSMGPPQLIVSSPVTTAVGTPRQFSYAPPPVVFGGSATPVTTRVLSPSYVPSVGGVATPPPQAFVTGASPMLRAPPPISAAAAMAGTNLAGTPNGAMIRVASHQPMPPSIPPAVVGQRPASQEDPREPAPPPHLTQGIPDPSSIDRQKASYAVGLDEQLQKGTGVLNQQLKQQTDYLYAVGDQKKRQYGLQIDQEIKQQEMALAQQHNEQVMLLQQAAQQQKSALEHQANALMLEYNQKKAQEELLFQQYNFQKSHYEIQLKYNAEMHSLQAQQQIASQQVSQQHHQIVEQVKSASAQAQHAHMTAAHALHQSTANAVASSVAVPAVAMVGTPRASYVPMVTAPVAYRSASVAMLPAAHGGSSYALPAAVYSG